MNWQNAKIECVLERDTDLLFLEEWSVNEKFAGWMLEQFGITEKFFRFDGFHSVTDPQYGESDLLLIAENESNKIALLLENKIDAVAQEEQAARYFLRAEKIRQELQLSCSEVGIIAPENYLLNNSEAANYPHCVSYESAAQWFASQNDLRSQYRAAVLLAAVEKERRGYRPVKDEQVSQFWHDYWEYLQKTIPEVEMKEPNIVPVGSDWPELKFAWFPAKWKLIHKLSRGVLDLGTDLSSEAAEELEKKLLDKGFLIVRTEKSYSIRLNVAVLDRNTPLAEQQDVLERCICGIKQFACKIF